MPDAKSAAVFSRPYQASNRRSHTTKSIPSLICVYYFASSIGVGQNSTDVIPPVWPWSTATGLPFFRSHTRTVCFKAMNRDSHIILSSYFVKSSTRVFSSLTDILDNDGLS